MMRQDSKRVLLKRYFAHAIQRDEKYFRKLNDRHTISEYFEGALIEYRWVYVCLLCGTPYYGECARDPNPMNFYAFIEHIRDEHIEWDVSYWLQHQRDKYVHASRKKTIPHPLKPWQDPESLYCDKEFLEKLLSKEIAEGKECKG